MFVPYPWRPLSLEFINGILNTEAFPLNEVTTNEEASTVEPVMAMDANKRVFAIS